MANFLQSLMSLLGGSQASQQPLIPQQPQPTMPTPQSMFTGSGLDTSVSPDQYAGQRQSSPAHHGGIGDFLGRLGDAFMESQGHEGLHQKYVDERDWKDAMGGADLVNNPLGAIQKLAERNPKLGFDAYQKYQENQARMSAAQETANYRDALIQQKEYTHINKLRETIGGLFGTIAGEKDRGRQAALWEQNIPSVKAWLQRYPDLAEEFPNLPDKFDPDFVQAHRFFGSNGGAVSKGLFNEDSIPINAQKADAMTATAGANVSRAGTAAAAEGESERNNRVKNRQADDHLDQTGGPLWKKRQGGDSSGGKGFHWEYNADRTQRRKVFN